MKMSWMEKEGPSSAWQLRDCPWIFAWPVSMSGSLQCWSHQAPLHGDWAQTQPIWSPCVLPFWVGQIGSWLCTPRVRVDVNGVFQAGTPQPVCGVGVEEQSICLRCTLRHLGLWCSQRQWVPPLAHITRGGDDS